MAGDNILFRCDSSTEIGSGHVMRCLALAKAWQRVGGQVCYLTAETIAALDGRFADDGFQQERLAVEPGIPEDAEQTAAWVRRLGARWVVVDGYRFKPDFVHRLKMSGVRVLFLDDDARFDFYEADVVLNQNIDAKAERYKCGATTHLLLGADYVLLRPEFLEERPRKDVAGVARRLLITMGGSDSENVTSTVVRALSQMGNEFEATVVVGEGTLTMSRCGRWRSDCPAKLRLTGFGWCEVPRTWPSSCARRMLRLQQRAGLAGSWHFSGFR